MEVILGLVVCYSIMLTQELLGLARAHDSLLKYHNGLVSAHNGVLLRVEKLEDAHKKENLTVEMEWHNVL